MKKTFLLFIFTSFSNVFAANSDWTFVKTPRGTEVEIKIVKSQRPEAALLVIAPGQSCNSKGPLFDLIEKEALSRDINIVRFEWSYCSKENTNHDPSDDLSNEIADMQFVIIKGQNISKLTDENIWIAGKSLGSLVAYQIFKNKLSLKSLTLLTPVCSTSIDDQNKPLPSPLDVMNENYPDLKIEKRAVHMISGDRDPLCDHGVLNNFKLHASENLEIASVKGDHGFSIWNADNSINTEESQKTKIEVVNQMFNWYLRK